MKAVILAAGVGSRLRPLTDKLPKSFIPVDGKPLIEYSLDNLKDAGITEAVIVTGFMESFFKKELGDCHNGIEIQYISNKEYESTGSMYSLSRTEGKINEDIILFESDLLYEPRAIERLLDSPEPDVILVAPASGSNDEVFIEFDGDGRLTDLGKDVPPDRAYGELAGITKLSREFLQELYGTAKEDYAGGEMKRHYEEVIFKLSKKYPINCLLIKDLAWIEIDNQECLKKAREVIFPKIKNVEKKHTS